MVICVNESQIFLRFRLVNWCKIYCSMRALKNIPQLHLNIIDRDLLLVLACAAAIALAFGTLVVMAVSRL